MLNSELQKDTEQLKKWIKKAERSAKQAWKAGEKLSIISQEEKFKPDYNSFRDYTKEEFNINERTANKYIVVYQKIPFELITDNMLVSHLYTIATMQEELKYKILETMAWAETNSKFNENKNQQQTYDNGIILTFKQIIESIKEEAKNTLKNQDYHEIFELIYEQDTNESKQKERRRKDPLKDAEPLINLDIHEKFKDVSTLYYNTPISEQGFVGLFCTIFHIVKELNFLYQDKQVKFSKIIYIRTEFPDALIELQKNDDTPHENVSIEFELDSFNYWIHEHHKAKEKCKIIICWEHGEKFKKLMKKINSPYVLSIKEVLETGKIKLHK